MTDKVGEVGNPANRRSANAKSTTTGSFTWSVWESRGVWMEYDPLICEVIEAAFVKGQNTVCSSQDHVIYFNDMLQYDVGPSGPDPRPVCRHASFGRGEVLLSLRRRNQVLRNVARDINAQGMKDFSCSGGRYEQAGIGCSLSTDPHDGPVFIGELHPGGPAALSGKIARGDRLVTINGTDVIDIKDTDRLAGPPNTVVSLGVRRHGHVEIVQLLRQSLPVEEDEAEGQSEVGVGISTQIIDAQCYITDLSPAGAAYFSGEITEGDMISAIDGQVLQENAPDRWLSRIRGREFSRVVLTVVSCRTGGAKDLYLIRRREYSGMSLAGKITYDAGLKECSSNDVKGIWGSTGVVRDALLDGSDDEFDFHGWSVAQEASEAINKVGARLGHVAQNAVASVGERVGENKWNVLQFGSHVTGLVRGVTSAVSNVVQTAVSETQGLPRAATTISGGTLSQVFIRSGEDVEGLSINGVCYGSSDGGDVSEIKSQVTIKEIHTWKRQHSIRFIRIVFSDRSEISGGTRGEGAYKGLVINGSEFRIRSSSFRILDIELCSVQHGSNSSISYKSSQARRPPFNAQTGAARDTHATHRGQHKLQGLEEFSSISDPALIESLEREGGPVPGDPTVFKWRGMLMLQPYWSKGYLIVRGVPSGDIVYRGKPPSRKEAGEMIGKDKDDGCDLKRDAQLLLEILPGRLSEIDAINTLKRNDMNVALCLNELLAADGGGTPDGK